MNLLPGCDCLNFCGDDPRIDKGKATPCLGFLEAQKEVQLRNAAPELLAALKSITDAANEKRVTAEHYEVARAAIAKATGEQS